ncbi:MAG: GGDEF domain-containing protein, partial [Gammaproteobacteria bacterium]|nr:GGDEF domain-containing protein [Gammaproteobacteria bacterium]
IYIQEKDSNELVPHAYVGTRDDLPSMKVGEGLPGQVAKTGECLIISTSEYMAGEMLEMGYARSAPREMAYIPLVYQERVLGVLMIGCMEIYGESERQLFDYLADQISVALDNAMMHRRIHEMSVTDGLTGLYNRRMLNIRLAEEWAASTRHERPMSILLADADDFKSINDEYGHDKGDQVLQMFAEIFRSNTRKEDLVARYGGEEFVAVLPDTEIADAKVLAERVREVASNHIFSWKGGAVTLSIGVATYPNLEVETGEELIQLADKAMYEAKARGKNKVAVADRKWVKKVS